MIHVPDVSATVDWYTSMGFKVIRQNEGDGEINWAKLSFGNSELMLNAGGKPRTFTMPSTACVSSSFVTSTDSGSRSDNPCRRSCPHLKSSCSSGELALESSAKLKTAPKVVLDPMRTRRNG